MQTEARQKKEIKGKETVGKNQKRKKEKVYKKVASDVLHRSNKYNYKLTSFSKV